MRTGPPFPGGEQVTVVRPALTTDRYNNETPNWDDTTEFVLCGCAVAPGNITEDTEGRESGQRVDHTLYVTADVATGMLGWTAFGQPLEAIWPTDRLRFRGRLSDVVGEIDVWVNPSSGNRPGCVVRTTRTEG